jgi:uncharacterized membrane protein YagU involved in acid resistance
MVKLDLNFVCRVYEWVAIITFVLGIIVSIVFSIHTSYFGGATVLWGTLLTGFVYTFLASMFFLFLSRIGDAIDDIRNKLCYPEETQPTEVNE